MELPQGKPIVAEERQVDYLADARCFVDDGCAEPNARLTTTFALIDIAQSLRRIADAKHHRATIKATLEKWRRDLDKLKAERIKRADYYEPGAKYQADEQFGNDDDLWDSIHNATGAIIGLEKLLEKL